MATRILKVEKPDPCVNLYEDEPKRPEFIYAPYGAAVGLPGQQVQTSVSDSDRLKGIVIRGGECLAGLIVLWFGVFNAGSMFGQGTMFTGILAQLFYVDQVAWIMEILGMIIMYDAVKGGYIDTKNMLELKLSQTIESLKNKNKGYS